MDRRALGRRAASISVAVIPFGVAFGATAGQAGLSLWQTVGFSALVFTGSAQFAAVTVLGAGGSAVAAIAAGLLLSLRCLAFGLVMAPVMTWRRPGRALAAQVMIDEAVAVGTASDDPALRRFGYLAAGIGVFLAWNISTLVGATLVPPTGTLVTDLGLDATIPAAFLALLWPRLADPAQRRVALGGALVAVVLVPMTPAGVPVVAAAAAVLLGLRGPRPVLRPVDPA